MRNPKQILFDKVWKTFSEYVRRRDNGICFTCGIKKDIKEMQAGHFRHGKGTPIYFHEKNVHCQCKRCNTYLSGNRDIYLRNVQKKYGIKTGDWLIQQSFLSHYWKVGELEKLLDKYKVKLDKIKRVC